MQVLVPPLSRVSKKRGGKGAHPPLRHRRGAKRKRNERHPARAEKEKKKKSKILKEGRILAALGGKKEGVDEEDVSAFSMVKEKRRAAQYHVSRSK